MALISQVFWEKFYSSERSEWYFSTDIVRLYFNQIHERKGKFPTVLHGGCGNAVFDDDIYNSGLCIEFDFASNSFSEACGMERRVTIERNLIVADALRLPFFDASCDIIVEKGLFDSITSCDSLSSVRGHAVVCEYFRLLSDNGIAMIFSLFGPDSADKDMLGLLSHDGFSVECKSIFVSPIEIPSQQFCFLYLLTKNAAVVQTFP